MVQVEKVGLSLLFLVKGWLTTNLDLWLMEVEIGSQPVIDQPPVDQHPIVDRTPPLPLICWSAK